MSGSRATGGSAQMQMEMQMEMQMNVGPLPISAPAYPLVRPIGISPSVSWHRVVKHHLAHDNDHSGALAQGTGSRQDGDRHTAPDPEPKMANSGLHSVLYRKGRSALEWSDACAV